MAIEVGMFYFLKDAYPDLIWKHWLFLSMHHMSKSSLLWDEKGIEREYGEWMEHDAKILKHEDWYKGKSHTMIHMHVEDSSIA